MASDKLPLAQLQSIWKKKKKRWGYDSSNTSFQDDMTY